MGWRPARLPLGIALCVALATPAGAGPWSAYGGDATRSSSYRTAGTADGVAPVEALWVRASGEGRNVTTAVLTTDGPPGEERVVFGTGDGRLHLLTRSGGVPVTPPGGLLLSTQSDPFGDAAGDGTAGFADTSTPGALGQVWVVFNDRAGVSVAQVDETAGDLVQRRDPPAGDALADVRVTSAVLLGPPEPDGRRSLYFVAGPTGRAASRLYRVPIDRPGSRDAAIGPVSASGAEIPLNPASSPTYALLGPADGTAPQPYLLVGDCQGRLVSFNADLVAGAAFTAAGPADCVLTAATAPAPPGQRTPGVWVPSSPAGGRSTGLARLVPGADGLLAASGPGVNLLGASVGAPAVDVDVRPDGTLVAGGRVYVATGRNLYAVGATTNRVTARAEAGDDLVPGESGFSRTSPAAASGFVFAGRDNGTPAAFSAETMRPLPSEDFSPATVAPPADGRVGPAPDAARADAGQAAPTQPSPSERTVVFGGRQGIAAYRLRAPGPASGYWMVASDGAVLAYGDAGFFGSTGDLRLNSPIAGMAPTPTGTGYWLVARDGGVFAFGDAAFHGAASDTGLDSPVVGLAPTPGGRGYWLATADGGVLGFGDAAFLGSPGRGGIIGRIVGITPTPTGRGYWLTGDDGAVYNFGDAGHFGSAADTPLAAPVVGFAPMPAGNGYWLVAADGGVLAYGSAVFYGSMGGTALAQPMVGIAGGQSGRGYHLVARDGGVFNFGDAGFWGSAGDLLLNAPVIAVAATG